MKKLTDGRRTPSDGNTLPDPKGSGELKKELNTYAMKNNFDIETGNRSLK